MFERMIERVAAGSLERSMRPRPGGVFELVWQKPAARPEDEGDFSQYSMKTSGEDLIRAAEDDRETVYGAVVAVMKEKIEDQEDAQNVTVRVQREYFVTASGGQVLVRVYGWMDVGKVPLHDLYQREIEAALERSGFAR